ncbi:MAG: hypothetical protein J5654_08685 [Victivallales bacterium]|nr:hypothetical protein [Victivallales bacterium]MBR5704495.1 hypothetical protein [Deltaproteobacteria bacterium]
MDTFLSLLDRLNARYGIFYAILISGGIGLLWIAINRFGSTIAGWLRHWSRRKLIIVDKGHLLGHQLFFKLRHYTESRLVNLNCQCVLRKRLFGDLMTIRLNVEYKMLQEFIKRSNFHVMPAEFQATVEAEITAFFHDWEREAAEAGIPGVVLERFVAAITPMRQSLLSYVGKSFVSDYITGDSNYAQMNRLLDVISGLEELIIVQLESTLDSMNGEISGLDYKGIICTHCPQCQSTHAKSAKGTKG